MQIGRLADVLSMTQLSRMTIDRLEKAGNFPQRIKLGRQATGWDLDEVQKWLDERPRGIRRHISAPP